MKKIILKIKKWWMLHHNNDSRLKYYRSIGVNIGNCIITALPNFGTEPYLVEIGDNCLLAGCTFHTHDGGVHVLNTLNFFHGQRMDKMGRIRVGNNCFLGNASRIMGGVTIGDNCIIGAGSIVTKSIPANSVVAGIPAKVICTVEEYYEKNKEKGNFYPAKGLDANHKRKYLTENVKKL